MAEPEKRNYVRYVLWLPVTLVLKEGKIGTICRDASSGGLLLSSPMDILAGTETTVRLRLSVESNEEHEIAGRVVRSGHNADDLELVFPFRLAVEFINPASAIEELLQTWSRTHSRLSDRP